MLEDQLSLLHYTPIARCMDDPTLLAGLKRGDPEAVEYAVHRYAPALYRFAYYQLHDATAAEDLVAEVMARMVCRVDSFVLEQVSFQTWLFRIARNLVADHYRTRKRRPQISLEEWLMLEPECEPGRPDPHLEAVPEREELLKALHTLTQEQQQVIIMHAVEGWDMPRVALMLERSLASVKGLYYRGMESLRRALASDEQTDM
jgi:RNA polymerase sigma-70 factor (ECF subfamily)